MISVMILCRVYRDRIIEKTRKIKFNIPRWRKGKRTTIIIATHKNGIAQNVMPFCFVSADKCCKINL